MPLSNTIEKTNTVATRSLRIRLSLCADHFRWTRPRRRGLGHPTLEAELRPLSIGKRTPKWVYWQSDSLYSTSVPHRGTQRVGMTNVQAFSNESGVLRSPTALRPGPFLESMTCCCRVVVTNLCVLVLPGGVSSPVTPQALQPPVEVHLAIGEVLGEAVDHHAGNVSPIIVAAIGNFLQQDATDRNHGRKGISEQ